MERKDFLKQVLALSCLGVIPVAVIESCSKSNNTSAPTNVDFTLDLTNSANAALNNVGGYMVANGVIVIQYAAGAFAALSAACTHEGCIVSYSASSAKVVCPCHGGTFNATTGAVISGPPPSALKTYSVTRSGNVLAIKS